MNYQYLNADQLVDLLRTADHGKDFQVVDVRDDDFRGGNIPGAIRAPSEQRTDQSVEDLVQQLKDVPTVIFHCTLSQVRGPKAARIYADAMAKARQPDEQAAAAKTEDLGTAPSQDAAAAGAGVDFSPNPYLAQQRTDGAQEQQVYVLRDGFGGWQSLHKKDPLLVENFDATIWG